MVQIQKEITLGSGPRSLEKIQWLVTKKNRPSQTDDNLAKKGRRKALLHTWQSLFFPLCTRLRFSDAKQLKRLFPFPRLRSFSKRMMLSPVKVLSSKSAEARSVFWPFCHLDGKSLAFDKRRPICLSHSWPSWCPSNAHSRRTQGRCV